MSLEAVDPADIFAPTEKGSDELKYGSTRLPLAALELLVLFDGKKNLAKIIESAKGYSPEEFRNTAQSLARDGYIEIPHAEPEVVIDMSFLLDGEAAAAPLGNATPEARAEADIVEQRLSLDGYYVSIARRAATRKKPSADTAYSDPDAWTYSVLVVEDNPDIQRSLRLLLTFEKFEPRLAGNRKEIVAELRRVPSPDLILLDVNLPDANGFDILDRIRQHPVLKSIPVIMLTAQANRDDVLRGIAGGADGYITKPFENEILIRSVRSVLGF
jgi:two-component system, OmpR family, response regulator